MKALCILSALALVGTCATKKYATKIQDLKDSIQLVDTTIVKKYANTITAAELSKHLYAFSSDDYQGRKTGELGQKKAALFLKTYYKNEQIGCPMGDSIYYQIIPKSFLPKDIKSSENVLAFIKGVEIPDEVVIISAHIDHLGISEDGQIHNGADDDGSGTVAIMEMAQAFMLAKMDGYGPKRSLLFLHLTAEEQGKLGSEYYTMHPVFPLENTVVDLNIDMIGRVDKLHEKNRNYVYLIGSDRLSKELHYLSEKVNNTYVNIDLDYRFNAIDDRNQYYTRSDHYNFAKHGVPVIFYFNGQHKDYHRATDTPDKIDFDLLEKRTKLIFATAWQIANQKNRIKVDENI